MLLAANVTARALFLAADHDVTQRVGGGVEIREILAIVSECCGGAHWNVPVVAFQSLRCIENCSDDKKCNTQHSQTDRWSDHGCYVHSSGLVERSEKLCACTSGIETVGRALNRHQWETARHQRSVRGYHRGIAHADTIPAEVRGKSCVPWVGGQDVEIVKQHTSVKKD